MRNYRSAFIDGTSNIHTSTFKEHATTDMHARAMSLFKKQQSSSVLEYAPIARALINLPMDERSKQRTKRKFEVSYMIAKEKLACTIVQNVHHHNNSTPCIITHIMHFMVCLVKGVACLDKTSVVQKCCLGIFIRLIRALVR